MAKSKSNTADGSKSNGGAAPHKMSPPVKAKKGAATMPQGKHPMAPGCNTATN